MAEFLPSQLPRLLVTTGVPPQWWATAVGEAHNRNHNKPDANSYDRVFSKNNKLTGTGLPFAHYRARWRTPEHQPGVVGPFHVADKEASKAYRFDARFLLDQGIFSTGI